MNKDIQEIIDSAIEQDVKFGQVFFFRKGDPIKEEQETYVIANRYKQYLEIENQYEGILSREEILKQIISNTKEEINQGFSVYSDNILIDFSNLEIVEKTLIEIESSDTFYKWTME